MLRRIVRQAPRQRPRMMLPRDLARQQQQCWLSSSVVTGIDKNKSSIATTVQTKDVVDCYSAKSRVDRKIPLIAGGSNGSSINATGSTSRKYPQLPAINLHEDEFPPSGKENIPWMAVRRILRMAAIKVFWEPPTLHLLAASACATLTVGMVEASLMVQPDLFWTVDSATFMTRYAVEQLFPSVVWETQEASVVATALGMDPTVILNDLSGKTTVSANLLLQTHFLGTSRYFFAGFMMIAQILRAGSISVQALEDYESRIRNGREPPFLPATGGLVVRLCGRDSHVSEVSLARMGRHFWPVLEDPERVQFLVWKHSAGKRRPVYWCVRHHYASRYGWDRFPASADCFLRSVKGEKILVLEADATNGNDPLTIGDMALDLNLDDASQGFRRILALYTKQGLIPGRDFQALRVYLGNSMETYTTGGGHHYTLRHRIRYAKEMDVLIDARAPVLQKILEWCEKVAKDGKILFQTSSPEYFLNLKSLLQEYGYELYDPLDLRMLHKLRQQDETSATAFSLTPTKADDKKKGKSAISLTVDSTKVDPASFQSSMLTGGNNEMDDGAFLHSYFWGSPPTKEEQVVKNSEMLRTVTKLARLPRLVHMRTTAETVNAIEAMIIAGEVDASSCCVLIDRQEMVASLEESLASLPGFVRQRRHSWTRQTSNEDATKTATAATNRSGLQIICSSSIHDDVLRQVRTWARMGYNAAEIQREIDVQYLELLSKSHSVQRQVRDTAGGETQQQSSKTTTTSSEGDGLTNNKEETKVPSVHPDVPPET